MAFIDLMKEKARKDVKTIVLPESNDERTLTAAAQVMKEKTANLILLGNEEKIMALRSLIRRRSPSLSIMRRPFST